MHRKYVIKSQNNLNIVIQIKSRYITKSSHLYNLDSGASLHNASHEKKRRILAGLTLSLKLSGSIIRKQKKKEI
jgi:hypothetical protein